MLLGKHREFTAWDPYKRNTKLVSSGRRKMIPGWNTKGMKKKRGTYKWIIYQQ